MTAIELILSLIPQLNPKEIEQLKQSIDHRNPCSNGHKFKHVMEKRFFLPPAARIYCERCGQKPKGKL